jgi:thioredoxin
MGNAGAVILEFWAPWCTPCRVMAPALDRLEQTYEGRVVVRRVNADEEPTLVRSHGVRAIPTVIAFAEGRELGRRTGVQPAAALEQMFVAAEAGTQPPKSGPTRLDRGLRLGAGALLIGLAAVTKPLLALAGAVVIFSAVYDRCPIWNQLVAPTLRRLGLGGRRD